MEEGSCTVTFHTGTVVLWTTTCNVCSTLQRHSKHASRQQHIGHVWPICCSTGSCGTLRQLPQQKGHFACLLNITLLQQQQQQQQQSLSPVAMTTPRPWPAETAVAE
jgi:hypothetical protein